MIQPGDVLRIPEADYLFGTGELHLRVMEVGRVLALRDGHWLEVRGMQLTRAGVDYRLRPQVLIRLRATTNVGRPAPPADGTGAPPPGEDQH